MTRELKLYKLIEADRDRLWQALTDPTELSAWLGDVRFGLAVGSTLAVTSAIPHVSGEHTLEAFEPGEWLRFTWRIAGHETGVSWRLEDYHGLSRIIVLHELPEDLPASLHIDDSMGTKLGFVAEVWWYALDLLKTFVESGSVPCRLPSTDDPLAVRLSIDLPAAPEKVFASLVEPENIRAWNTIAGDGTKVEKRVGGRYSFGWKSEEKGIDGPHEVVEYEEGHKVTYTWLGDPKTLVSWEVEPLRGEEGPKTRLHLQHSGFIKDPDVVWEYKLGWAGFLYCILYSLKGRVPVKDVTTFGQS